MDVYEKDDSHNWFYTSETLSKDGEDAKQAFGSATLPQNPPTRVGVSWIGVYLWICTYEYICQQRMADTSC